MLFVVLLLSAVFLCLNVLFATVVAVVRFVYPALAYRIRGAPYPFPVGQPIYCLSLSVTVDGGKGDYQNGGGVCRIEGFEASIRIPFSFCLSLSYTQQEAKPTFVFLFPILNKKQSNHSTALQSTRATLHYTTLLYTNNNTAPTHRKHKSKNTMLTTASGRHQTGVQG